MEIKISELLLTNKNARPQLKLNGVRAIIMHWTANTHKGANALANRNYFNNPQTAASAHYIVDSTCILRCVPNDEVAYHVGAKSYAEIGTMIKLPNKSPNFNTIGIEMCVNADDNFDGMKENAIKLAAMLLLDNHLTIDDLLRHYDITGKNCPQFLLEAPAWNDFKQAVQKMMEQFESYPFRRFALVNTSSSSLNVRASADSSSEILYKIPKGHKVEIVEEKDNWIKIGYGWISADYISRIANDNPGTTVKKW